MDMTMPGFTAEQSLYKTDERYLATADTSSNDGLVRLAYSDTLDEETSLSPLMLKLPEYNCLKKVCTLRVVKRWPLIVVQECRWVHAIC
jgi:hypothetical protein